MVNHQIAHELLALQLITVCLEEPTDDSVEIIMVMELTSRCVINIAY